MSKLRRLLSIMMAMCLILTLLPMPARAVETELEPIQVTQVNPLYEGIVTEEDLLPVGEPFSFFAEPVYETEKGVLAAQLREAMVNRLETVTLYYQSGEPDAFSGTLMREVLNMALKHTGVPIEGDYLAYQYAGWSGSMSGHNDGFYDYIELTYTLTYYTSYEQEELVTAQVNALLNDLNLAGMTNYQKIKAVYDYMCQNITYDYAHLNDNSYKLQYTAYAALINKTSVCQGYAVLLYRLLLEMGIDCRVIPGIGNGGPHAWNIIKVGNYYYNTDATWDAGRTHYGYFLRGSNYFPDHYRDADWDVTNYPISDNYPISKTDYDPNAKVELFGVCGDNATWRIEPDGRLIISGTGITYDYSDSDKPSLRAPWNAWKDSFHTVIVEEGITRIGSYSFIELEGDSNILSVSLPDSLREIGQVAFAHCDKLTEIHIPEGVKRIENGLLEYCTNLEKVTLSSSLEGIGSNAFHGCTSLKEINLPETLQTIDIIAFDDCDSLTEVTIPAGVACVNGFMGCDNLQTVYVNSAGIGGFAFAECPKLENVVLGSNVQWIEPRAFWKCTSLKQITFPKGLVELRNMALDYCPALEEVRFTGDAPIIMEDAFKVTTVTAYYPACNPSWTEEVRQNYEGTITWIPYECHDYEAVVTPATCAAGGYTTYTCSDCGYSYVAEKIPAELHSWTEGPCGEPRTCTVCGEVSRKDGHIYDDMVDGTCNYCGVHRETVETRKVHHMLRMYNPNTGEHFYTGSEEERDMLVTAGWNYEGVAFTFPANTGAPVHRLFQPSTGEHLYTMDEEEKDRLLSEGWNYEGIAFNSAYDTEAVQHRLYNPNTTVGAYHFTFSLEERDNLIAAGWWYQGIGWYSCWK